MTVDPAVDREIVFGILHMLYHMKHIASMYSPAQANRRCYFCPKPGKATT